MFKTLVATLILTMASIALTSKINAVANETFTASHDPDFLVLNPEGE